LKKEFKVPFKTTKEDSLKKIAEHEKRARKKSTKKRSVKKQDTTPIELESSISNKVPTKTRMRTYHALRQELLRSVKSSEVQERIGGRVSAEALNTVACNVEHSKVFLMCASEQGYEDRTQRAVRIIKEIRSGKQDDEEVESVIRMLRESLQL
jgi:hypothetical protein